MVGTGGVSLFGAVTQYLIMVLLGLPLALPLAVLAFLLGFIPYIGSFIATGLAFLVAIAVGTPQDIAIMAIYTIVMNIVQGNFVAPIVYSRAVNLHPAVVLMAIPAGSEVAGILGMFLAVPFLGVIAATWRTVLDVFATHADASPGPPAPEPEPEPEARSGRTYRGRRDRAGLGLAAGSAPSGSSSRSRITRALAMSPPDPTWSIARVLPANAFATSSRADFRSKRAGGGVRGEPFLESFQAEGLVGGFDLDQFAPGLDALALERLPIRLPPLLEGVALDLLLALDGGDPPAFERAHELVRWLDMQDDHPFDLDAVAGQRAPGGRSELGGLRSGEIEDVFGGRSPDQQPQGVLTGRLADLVEIGRGDREHELFRTRDAEGQQDVDRDAQAFLGRHLSDRDIERDLASRDEVRDRDPRRDDVVARPDRPVDAPAPQQDRLRAFGHRHDE